jgi:hypothetical protein
MHLNDPVSGTTGGLEHFHPDRTKGQVWAIILLLVQSLTPC